MIHNGGHTVVSVTKVAIFTLFFEIALLQVVGFRVVFFFFFSFRKGCV